MIWKIACLPFECIMCDVVFLLGIRVTWLTRDIFLYIYTKLRREFRLYDSSTEKSEEYKKKKERGRSEILRLSN